MSKQRQKGTLAETAVVKFLKANGFPDADRSPLRGSNDQGDVIGIGKLVIEVKNHKTYQIPEWLRELEVEIANAQAENGFVVIKPRGIGTTNVGQWWAVLPLERIIEMLEK